MDTNRLDAFMDTFSVQLPLQLVKHPDDYRYPVTDCPVVCGRIRSAIEKWGDTRTLNIQSPTWRATCKALNLKQTHKAIDAFLAGA